jgi:hypothetical protein
LQLVDKACAAPLMWLLSGQSYSAQGCLALDIPNTLHLPARMDKPVAASEDTALEAPVWSVRLKRDSDTLVAMIEGPFDAATHEFAFYLMYGRSRSAIRWYSADVVAHFARPEAHGCYHVTAFVRRRGAKGGLSQHSDTIELTPRKPQAGTDSSIGQRMVLVKSYYGLGGDLCVLLGAMRFARADSRRVVVDWSSGVYGVAQHGSLFHSLFEAHDIGSMGDIRGRALSVFPPCWAGRLESPPGAWVVGVPLSLSRPEEVPQSCAADCVVITRDPRNLRLHLRDYYDLAAGLRPVASVRRAVEAQVAGLANARYSIGIHYRHGNGEPSVIPPDPQWFVARIEKLIAEQCLPREEVTVYVATDCGAALDYFKRRFARTLDLEKQYRPIGEGPMHHGRTDLAPASTNALAEEALVDMYVLSQCDSFVGSLGYFSLFVQILRAGRHCSTYDGPRVFKGVTQPAHWKPLTPDMAAGRRLANAQVPLDGLYVEVADGRQKIHYYDTLVADTDAADAERASPPLDELRSRIVARRLY